MKISCLDCDKRGTCESLCKEANRYANQDYITQRHKLIPTPIVSEVPWPDPPITLGDEEWELILNESGITKDRYLEILRKYYWEHKTYDQIADEFNMFKTSIFRMNKIAKKFIRRNIYGEQMTIYKYLR